jgi:5'-methylthioadenosine phosphorylase
MSKRADIGIIGGSGVYEMFSQPEIVRVSTPYDQKTVPVCYGDLAGKKVAFIARHGAKHSIPPHLINYRANIFALHKLGVSKILSSGAVGSLRREMKPGQIVLADQFIDRTKSRPDTFISGPKVEHLSAADLYCPDLRRLAVQSCRDLNISCHEQATVVVINGPRFSSRAESQWFKKMGWDILSMTQYPENVLAAEMGIRYCNIGLVTDYDAGLEGEPGIKPVTWEQITEILSRNAKLFKKLVEAVVTNIDTKKPPQKRCDCN